MSLLDDSSTDPYVRCLTMTFDRAIDDSSDTIQRWASFESALMDVDGMNVPSVEIMLSNRDTAKDVLVLLLPDKILSRLHGRLRKVSLVVEDEDAELYLRISSDDIPLAPTQVTFNGETISLNAAQRAEWLLSKSKVLGTPRRVVRWDRREEYLRSLPHPARAATAMTGEGNETEHSAADEAHSAALGYIQETTDGEEPGGEDAGLDE